jgi:hypothetical protein
MGVSDRNKGLLTGIAVSLGLAALVKVIGNPLAGAARPLTKAGVRTVLDVRDKGEVWLAEAGETLSDIVAEVRAERAERAAERAEALAASHWASRATASGGDT